ncbi:MAG: hemerythrin domain-containing protein, partial [Caulobacteraceae bacterium]
MLKQDHRKVEALLGEFEKADEGRRAVLVKEVCQALIVHAELEEKLFYPAAREAAGEDKLCEAQVEHDAQKVLILELTEANGADRYRDAKFKVLGEEVKQHVKEEEAPDGVLAKAQKAGVATAELAEQMAQMKEQLLQKAQAGRLPEPRPVSLQHFGGRSRQETRMARQSTSRERDEYGRFVSDDDDERGRRRSRADDDDERGYRSRGRD